MQTRSDSEALWVRARVQLAMNTAIVRTSGFLMLIVALSSQANTAELRWSTEFCPRAVKKLGRPASAVPVL